MKNKILKTFLFFVLFSTLLITASFAVEIKEDVADYESDVYIIGSTRFDANQTITATMAANAGINEAKVQVALKKDISNLKVNIYFYDAIFGDWYEINKAAKADLIEDTTKIKNIEDNLNIFYEEGVEKTLEVKYEGKGNVDTSSLSNGVDYDKDSKTFTVPATTFTFTYTEIKTVDGEEVKVNKEVVTNVDKNLTAKNEDEIQEPVTVTIPENAAMKVGNEYFEAKDLATAIAASNAENPVTLLEDLKLDKVIELNLEGKSAVLDLNGKVLDSSSVALDETTKKSYALKLTAGELTINNGTIKTRTTDGYRNVLNDGATLNVNGINFTGHYNVDTNTKTSTKAATTNINSCELTSIFVGVTAWKNATVNIDNSIVKSDIYPVSGNGTQSNAIINITNSELESYTDVGVYMPSTETLNITDSTITGKSGIEIVAGTTNINSSTINATGEYTKTFAKESGDGSWVEGSAIFIRVQKDYNDGGTIALHIDGNSKLTSKNGDGIRVYETKSSTSEFGANRVYIKYDAENTIAENGNPINIQKLEKTGIADLTLTNQGIGQEVVNTEEDLIAAVNNTLPGGSSTQTILNADIELKNILEINDTVILNLNGHTIDSSNVAKDNKLSYGLKVTGEGNLTVKNGTMETLKETSGFMNIMNLEADLTVKNVKFIGYYNIYTNYYESENAGTTVIRNSTFDAKHACVCGWKNANVTIENSTLDSLWYAVSGNGTCENTVFNISNSTLTSEEDVAIYMPSTKSLTLTKCTVTGLSGIEAAAGFVTLNDTDIYATGNYIETFDKENGNGSWIEGSAIFVRVQADYGDASELKLNIDNLSTLNSKNGDGIRVYECTTSAENIGVNKVDINYYSNNVKAENGKVVNIQRQEISTKELKATNLYEG